MPIRRNQLMDRTLNSREATIFVIATEGAETEKQYFEGFNASRIKVVVLPTGDDGQGSPTQVLERLIEFQNRYNLAEDDELWVVVDVDRWGDIKLRDVCRDARNRCEMAVSNPCFELWLYLHFGEPEFVGKEWEAVLDQAHQNKSKAMEIWLRERLKDSGGYQKNNVKFERFKPGILMAVERAKRLHTNLEERWPTEFPGTHVYLGRSRNKWTSPSDRSNDCYNS